MFHEERDSLTSMKNEDAKAEKILKQSQDVKLGNKGIWVRLESSALLLDIYIEGGCQQ